MGDDHPEDDDASPRPRLIVEIHDERLGKLGCLVLDRPVGGATFGGVRFGPVVSAAELARVARTMTHKWAFLNVPMGGAKAGIAALPQRLCTRTALMEAFGRAIAPLVRRHVYAPGTDLGTTFDDLEAIMRGAGLRLRGPQIDAALGTALTVFEAIRQLGARHGRTLVGLRVAVEGFGKVGRVVCERLARAGATLVAVSTSEGGLASDDGLDVARLLALDRQHGSRLVHHYPAARRIAHAALFMEDVDLLVPGVRPGVIDAATAGQLRARWIVPIANAPLAPGAERALYERGIEVVPDFVANCGGLLAMDMRGHGFTIEDVERVVEGTLAATVRALLDQARHEGRPAGEVACRVAWSNHRLLADDARPPRRRVAALAEVLRRSGVPGIWRRLAWRAHRYGPVEPGIVRRAALERYVEGTLGVTLARLGGARDEASAVP